jgi:hypothetical protein
VQSFFEWHSGDSVTEDDAVADGESVTEGDSVGDGGSVVGAGVGDVCVGLGDGDGLVVGTGEVVGDGRGEGERVGPGRWPVFAPPAGGGAGDAGCGTARSRSSATRTDANDGRPAGGAVWAAAGAGST